MAAAGNLVTGNTVWLGMLVAPPILRYDALLPDLRDVYGRFIPAFTVPLTILP